MITKMRATPYLILSLLAFVVVCISPVMGAGDGFSSDAARIARAPGSPVGPPPRIIICHKGKTITVAEAAVPAHLAHGDTLGPCPNEVVICHRGEATKTVNEDNLPGHLEHGDTLGPCPERVFMCNNLGNTIVVESGRVADHQARGHTLGLCPGKQLVCYKGKTIKIDSQDLPKYIERGAYPGYCLGAQGPVIPSNSVPNQVSP
ncbi:MAG: hypothetical protein WCS70_12550 [Verrucomicrobiota bacterium]